MHNVPPGSETHFNVVLVCEAFDGKRKVARHQQVYQVLRDYLASGVHALALHTYSPQEWQARNENTPASPQCMGGSKQDV
jgi:BolA protein